MDKIEKTDDEWLEQLGEEKFYICRQKGTERAFTGQYYDLKKSGNYYCICCGSLLFKSENKYDSGSGWPSYWQVAEEGAVESHTDTSHGMVRTEVTCARCDSHLGHLFPDGPAPTGLRYCINSASLDFEDMDE